ncbi:protein G12-like [Chrysoperla carnea]|uniref:protein G12-like n=1 Tax=Chrysoperla carnea TaxID=189513 RepID=UPI001D0933E6|nr:protein G12-like [Chrysoperla carnea]
MKLFTTLFLLSIINLYSIYGINGMNVKQAKAGTLNDDIQDFKNILLAKSDELIELFGKYFAVDEQFRKDIQIFYGEEMKQLIKIIDGIPEFEQFVDYLYVNGVDEIYAHVALLHEVLNIPLPPFIQEHLPKTNKKCNKIKREAPPSIDKPGLNGFLENALKLIDVEALLNLYNQKLETSEPFQKLVEYLKSEKMLVIVRTVRNDQNYQKIVQSAIAVGIDVNRITEILHKLFGW